MTYASALVDIECCESCIAIQSGHNPFPWHPSHLLLSLKLPQESLWNFEQPFVIASYSLFAPHVLKRKRCFGKFSFLASPTQQSPFSDSYAQFTYCITAAISPRISYPRPFQLGISVYQSALPDRDSSSTKRNRCELFDDHLDNKVGMWWYEWPRL